MKRTLSCALALLTLLPALLTPARANSAPTHWEGSPGSEVLAVEADCPIAVLHEDLSFQVAESDDYSLHSQVKAVYQMENPTAEDADPGTGLVPLGDMVLSLERAEAQGKEFGHGTRREVAYLAVHSVLHLLGYDHMDEGPMKAQMRQREEAILGQLGIGRGEADG